MLVMDAKVIVLIAACDKIRRNQNRHAGQGTRFVQFRRLLCGDLSHPAEALFQSLHYWTDIKYRWLTSHLGSFDIACSVTRLASRAASYTGRG